jgi:hypothetical protein
MQKTVKLRTAILIAVLASILVGSVIATFLISHPITTTMIVKPLVSMGVFDIDGKTELNFIDMGQFQYGTIKYFPTGLNTPPTEYYYINNSDQQSFYVSFTWENLPPESNIGMQFYIKRGDKESFTSLGGGQIYNLPIETKYVNPDPLTQYAVWYFILNIASAPFGTYTPTLVVSAYSTASG